MTDEKLYEKLTVIFQEVFDNDDVIPVPEMVAGDVDEWDSLSNIRLFVAIEQEFKVRFSNAEIVNFKSVGQFIIALKSKLGLS